MIWLFWLALLSWAVVLAYMAPAVWSIYVRRTRKGDPARLVCLLYAMLMIGFLFRRVVRGDTAWEQDLAVLLVASCFVAGVTLFTAHTYGRGRHV